MFIKSLELKNFRNYESLSIGFDPGTNIFYGDNAQGKTNILEALFLCGTTKSHRGSKDKEILRFSQDEAHIRMILEKNNIGHKIDMHLRKNKAKGVAIDGIPIRKASDLFGIVNFVFFSPEDLNIIKNGPAERRKFMDSELCQLNKVYLMQLSTYNRIVMQRNKLLKEISFEHSSSLKSTLDVWDQQMVSCGRSLIREREKFIASLNQIIRDIHRNLTGGREDILLRYEPDVEEMYFEEQLFINRDRDIRMKLSSTGPHRDDFCILVGGVDIRKYGSQGQQRSAALSLKLSEISMMRSVIKDTPILLLDDVLSELDGNRQKYLLKSIKNIQTFITCTGMDDFIAHNFTGNKVFQVIDGNAEAVLPEAKV